MAMNILLIGAGFVNKGAEAMLRTVQTEICKRLSDVSFFLWKPTEYDYRPSLNSGLIPLSLPYENINSLWCWPRGYRVSSAIWSMLEVSRTYSPGKIISAAMDKKRRLQMACENYFNRLNTNIDAIIDISGLK